MIKAILACDEDWGIGKDGDMPWPHNPADLKWFKENTTGGVVDRQLCGGRANNRCENLHLPFRRQERAMQKFKSCAMPIPTHRICATEPAKGNHPTFLS